MLNAVIDISHWNKITNYNSLKSHGIIGIIHKATQGEKYVDPNYAKTKKIALENGMLWGSYHFGIKGDGEAQANFYLDTVKPEKNELIVLDFEEYADKTMPFEEAEKFVSTVFEKTGRWPGAYSSNLLKECMRHAMPTPLTNCWLWLAQFGQTYELPKGWKEFKLWQYVEVKAGDSTHAVPGVDSCDRNKFNGDYSGLTNFWENS